MRNLALFTDLYELTMLQGYYFSDPGQEAVFNMFFRRQPFDGGYAVFAGLAPLLEAISQMRFEEEDLAYLRTTGLFREEFLRYLADFRFRGDIFSVPEGSVVFPNEPLLRVQGLLMEAQLIEGMVLNFLNFQTLIATKAARIVFEAGDAAVLDFGLRRAQGVDGALSATRAAFIGGASGTSNVLAGQIYGIPVKGTMAHSWIMSFQNERVAFEKYAELYPENCILLVDTFDTLRSGVPNAIEVFKKLKERGVPSYGIRLDSGDLDYLSRESRRLLDASGLPDAKIFVSNELDEEVISQLAAGRPPIDGWGVGTRLVTGGRDSALTGVYKIVARKTAGEFEPCIKISNNPEKLSSPGKTGILRFFNGNGMMAADLVFLEAERDELLKLVEKRSPVRFQHPLIGHSHFVLPDYTETREMLRPFMRAGETLESPPLLADIRSFARQELKRLDPTFRRLLNPHRYKVSHSGSLYNLTKKLVDRYSAQ